MYKHANIRFYDTLPRKTFINLLRNAKALVGNSSMGILEAPFYHLPVVNVGNRQKGRLNAGNVHFVPADRKSIRQGLNKACLDQAYRKKVKKIKNPYGDGNTSARTIKVLKKVDLSSSKWMIKRNVWKKDK